jgi:hypothetical protein
VALRILPVLLLSAVAFAGDLLYLGLNARGHEEWYRVKDGAVVIRVPGGAYARRPYEGDGTTEKPRMVEVASFFMDKHEVTNAQFARFLNAVKETGRLVGAAPGVVRTADGWQAQEGYATRPVTAATGFGALAYAKWAGGYVPGPDEWMKAAGGVDGCLYPWGTAKPDATRANFARPAPKGTLPVGSFAAGASPYGCLDMAGNAYERVMLDGRGPVMIKGGSWLSPHPLNLRVLDLCMQPMPVAEKSVGFRCAMKDPEPERATRRKAKPATLRLAKTWDAALKEAREKKVPIFLSMQFDTCGQCDRIRAQLFKDPRFVAYCNAKMVVAIGHKPGHAGLDPHPEGKDEACPLHPGLECWEHEAVFNKAIHAVGRFQISPGNFVLGPDGAVLVKEHELPKWGGGVEVYLAAFQRARESVK